eukprot:668159-Pleurochrysis_carterae.AAC.1
MLRQTSLFWNSPRTSRMVTSVSGKLPVAPRIMSITSSLVVMLSPMRRTAAQSFSATRESPRRECAGKERLRRV